MNYTIDKVVLVSNALPSVYLVNYTFFIFYKTSCPACKLEAPNIETVSKEYEVLSIAVNSGSDEKVKAYMQEHELNFKVLNNVDGAWATKFKIEVYPTTFIYDAKAELRFTEVGYTTTVGLMARLECVE